MEYRTHTATNGQGQIHFYAGGQDNSVSHWENLGFEEITKFAHGHHGRTGGGNDVWNFIDLENVHGTIVGRLEDIDFSRDDLRIDGSSIDLNNLPQNISVVRFNGAHNDPDTEPQQWLLIETPTGGRIFYTLEGARVDMVGGDGMHGQERHFIVATDLPEWDTLVEFDFVDPQNYVPDGYRALGGEIINDTDRTMEHVEEHILGSDQGDLIGAGLNDDYVRGQDGHDRIWGGGGKDTLFGNEGHDTILGNFGEDRIIGGKGNDRIEGGYENDRLMGSKGLDELWGDEGNDRLTGGYGKDHLYGGSGRDKLIGGKHDDMLDGGSGRDMLRGGEGTDTMMGGTGADEFVFRGGDLQNWDEMTGTAEERYDELDVIADFELGKDKITLEGVEGANSLSDLSAWIVEIDGSRHFVVRVRETDERFLVNVDDTVSWSDIYDATNFNFL